MTDRLWKVITNVTLAFGGLFRIQQIGNVCWWMILNMHLESINWEYVVTWIFYYFGSKEIFKIKLPLLGKGSCQKKTFFLEYLSQICLPTHPPQGFCEIWENERWNSGRKRRFSGWFGGVLRGLDLVWESATPPTHIWEKSPKKKTVLYFGGSLTPLCQEWGSTKFQGS